MQIDFSQVFKTLGGEPIQKPDGKGGMTLGGEAANALILPNNSDSGEEKAKAYHLAMRVYKGGAQEVTVEEAALIKKKIGEHYGPIIVGPAFEMLEGKAA